MLSLSNILKINAISSGVTGLMLVVFPQFVADVFEVTVASPFIMVGVFLVLFSLFVFMVSMKLPLKIKSVMTIVALDIAWVIGSAIALVLLYSSISFIGSMVIAGVALWVGLMAYLQNRGVRSVEEGNNNFVRLS